MPAIKKINKSKLFMKEEKSKKLDRIRKLGRNSFGRV